MVRISDLGASQLKKLNIAMIATAAILVGSMIAMLIINASTVPTYLEISVSPGFAKLEIDGQEYANGSYEFEPGTYKAKISAEGFTSKQITFDVAEHSNTQLYDYLINEAEGMAYYERSSADIENLRKINDTTVQSFLQALEEKLSIKDQLPMVANYQIKGGIKNIMIVDGSDNPACKRVFCLLVKGGVGEEDYLREYFKNNRLDYADYQIIYE